MTTVLQTQPEQGDLIPVLREQIDALDAAIAKLVAERVQVSRRIQTARMNAGGTRVELGRERVVLAGYRDGPRAGRAAPRGCRPAGVPRSALSRCAQRRRIGA